MIRKYSFLMYLLLLMVANGCIEDFEVDTSNSFENILVVEAILTNDQARQEILLSRTAPIEEETIEIKSEKNAVVKVVDDLGNEYNFVEEESGAYISPNNFVIDKNRSYQLFITTVDGIMYQSDMVRQTSNSSIDNLYAKKMLEESTGIEGIGVFVDSSGLSENQDFYRYQYQETYKIVTPSVIVQEFVIESEFPLIINLVPTTTDRVCYKTVASNNILLASTEGLEENRIDNFLVTFIPFNAFSLRTRYSILVQQYLQSREADLFYTLLDKFSDLENLFSQAQPGFISGNIRSVNTEQKVLGLFELSTKTERRIFFEHDDFFPEKPSPLYVDDCISFSPNPSALLSTITSGEYLYLGPNEEPLPEESPYLFVPRICGDCTELGTAVVPDFWID